MDKNSIILDNICKEYSSSQRSNNVKGPRLVFGGCRSAISAEGYVAEAFDGLITVRASTSLGAAYGCAQLANAALSGCVAEYLGYQEPRFPLRPLWLGGHRALGVSDSVKIALPGFITSDHLEDPEHALEVFCQRIIEFGYNAVIFGAREDVLVMHSLESSVGTDKLFEFLRHCGLKVIIKPTIVMKHQQSDYSVCPTNPEYVAGITEALQEWLHISAQSPDYVLWETKSNDAHFFHHPSAVKATHYDLVVAEVAMIEKALEGRASLIAYLSSPNESCAQKQAAWLSQLCDDVGDSTMIAFSAVAGYPHEDYRPQHPFWEELHRSPDTSATPLLPIINAGCLGIGEGLWPVLSVDATDKVMCRLYRHPFAGAIAITNGLPMLQGLLGCSLWVAGHALWTSYSPAVLTDTWLAARRPELKNPKCLRILDNGRRIALELEALRASGREHSTEALHTKLEKLLLQLADLEGCSCGEQMSAFVENFTSDARRLIVLLAQQCSIPLGDILHNDNATKGFWTRCSKGSSKRTISLEEMPVRIEDNVLQTTIFDENRQFCQLIMRNKQCMNL